MNNPKKTGTVKSPTTSAPIIPELKNLQEKVEHIQENLTIKKTELQQQQELLETKKMNFVQDLNKNCATKSELVYEDYQKNRIQKTIQDTKQQLDNIKPQVVQVSHTSKQSQHDLAILKQTYSKHQQSCNEMISKYKNKFETLENKLHSIQHEAVIFRQQHEKITIENDAEYQKVLNKLNESKKRLLEQNNYKKQLEIKNKEYSNRIFLEGEKLEDLQGKLKKKVECQQEFFDNISFGKEQFEKMKEQHSSKLSDVTLKSDAQNKKLEALKRAIENQILHNNDLREGLQNENNVISNLNLENESLKVTYSILESNLEQTTKAFDSILLTMKKEVERLRIQTNKEENVLTKMDEDLINKMQQFEEHGKTIKTKQENIEILKTQIDDLNLTVTTSEANQIRLSTRLLENKNELEVLQKELESNENKILQVVTNQEENKSNFDKLHSEKKDKLKLMEREFDSIQAESLNLQKENDDVVLQSKKVELEKESALVNKDILNTTIKLGALKKHLEKLDIVSNQLNRDTENLQVKQASPQFALPQSCAQKRDYNNISDTSSDSILTSIHRIKKAKHQVKSRPVRKIKP